MFDKFKVLKNQIENNTCLAIKVFHIDHGKEFLYKTFNIFFQNETIE